jgi:hypothetical protein
MYSEILPKVASNSRDVANSLIEIEDFRKYLKNTDYDMLFKASKMVYTVSDMARIWKCWLNASSTSIRLLT